MKRYTALTLFLLSCSFSSYAGNFPKVEKQVIIDQKAASALTNTVEISLHQTRIPKVEFAQAHIRDIVEFLNYCIKQHGATKKAKSIRIVLDPKIVFISKDRDSRVPDILTFGGLDMSVLETITVLQSVTGLEYVAKNNMLTLKQNEKPRKSNQKVDHISKGSNTSL